MGAGSFSLEQRTNVSDDMCVYEISPPPFPPVPGRDDALEDEEPVAVDVPKGQDRLPVRGLGGSPDPQPVTQRGLIAIVFTNTEKKKRAPGQLRILGHKAPSTRFDTVLTTGEGEGEGRRWVRL